MNAHDSALVSYASHLLGRRISDYPGDFGRDLLLFRRLNAAYRDGATMDELRAMERAGMQPIAQRRTAPDSCAAPLVTSR